MNQVLEKLLTDHLSHKTIVWLCIIRWYFAKISKSFKYTIQPFLLMYLARFQN